MGAPDNKSRDPSRDHVRRRAAALSEKGMPFQMAMAVASGRMDLSEALDRMARHQRAERLMEQHELSRALATQIALGHADLQHVLRRRRLETHRSDHRDRSILAEMAGSGHPVTLALHGKRRLTGLIESVDVYTFKFQPEEGPVEEIHKLQVKFAHEPDVWKEVRKATRTDKDLSRDPKGPIERPQDRYNLSDKRLFWLMDEGTDVHATLLEGEILKGRVTWFSRFEFGLQLKGDADLVVFRHALHDLAV